MLGIAVLAGAVWAGLAVVRMARLRLSSAERLVVGPVVGVVAGSWLVYLAASAAGRMSSGVLAGAGALFVASGIASLFVRRIDAPRIEPWFWKLAAVLTLAVVALNLYGVFARDGVGNTLSFEHVWADGPFHASMLNAFAHNANYPPQYPIALGTPLGYPFIVNVASAVLAAGGLPLRWAVVGVNVFVHVAAFLGVALVTLRLTGSRRAAVLSAGLLFGLGNFGWLAIPQDVSQAGGFWRWITDLPWSYTGDALGQPGRDRLGTGIYLGNPTFIYLLPRRSGALGLAAGFSALLLFLELVRKPRWGVAVVTGVLVGLMPRVHGQTLIVLAIFAVGLFILRPSSRDAFRSWTRPDFGPLLVAGLVAAVIGIPEVIKISGQAEGFVSLWLGWTGEAREAFVRLQGNGFEIGAAVGALFTLLWFWVLNGGLLFLLVIPAWRAAPEPLKRWYLPLAAVWVFGNLVKTQPWEWDNNTFFHWWQAGTAILVASFLSELWGRRTVWARRAVAGAMVAMTLGGALSILYVAENRLHMWSPPEAQFALDVRDKTRTGTVVLTSNDHTHPVIALSGRQYVMGFAGWLSTQGLDWQRYDEQVVRMYRGDVELMRRLGVEYVVVSPWERNFAQAKGFTLPDVFADREVFRPLRTTTIAGQRWQLLELRT